MKRLFNVHETRKPYDLNGNWLFKLDPDKDWRGARMAKRIK